MSEALELLKKLNFKDKGQAVLVLHAPEAYGDTVAAFQGPVHTSPQQETYEFAQAFGTSNAGLQARARELAAVAAEDGLVWLCYPKKTSKVYKGSDCSRESVATLLADEGFEPVRQIAIDDDWSALRLRRVENIKSMTRKSAVTAQGKERIGGNE